MSDDYIDADIHLPYFKQGDDLRHCLEETNTPLEALDNHVKIMQITIELLKNIQFYIKEFKVQNKIHIDAGTHHIGINGPKDFINKLIKLKLATTWDEDTNV